MKNSIRIITFILMIIVIFSCEQSVNPIQSQSQNSIERASLSKKVDSDCFTITSKEIYYPVDYYLGADELITSGTDDYGFNYLSHKFNGNLYNFYISGGSIWGSNRPPYDGDDETYLLENPGADRDQYWEGRNWNLKVNWNNTYLSNTSCDGDNYLDKPRDYIGTDAEVKWYLTMDNGEKIKQTIRAVPVGSYLDRRTQIWYNSDGTEIGPLFESNGLAIVDEKIKVKKTKEIKTKDIINKTHKRIKKL